MHDVMLSLFGRCKGQGNGVLECRLVRPSIKILLFQSIQWACDSFSVENKACYRVLRAMLAMEEEESDSATQDGDSDRGLVISVPLDNVKRKFSALSK